MIVSLNPTYHCNFRCHFCYLTADQLADKNKIDLNVLDSRMSEIDLSHPIDMVDLYGGEIGLLHKSYLSDLLGIVRKYTRDINLVTNLSMIHPVFMEDDIYISVSWDYKVRQDWQRVYQNMLLLDKPFTVLMLATPELISYEIEPIIEMLNQLSLLRNVEIKPYSMNQANSLFRGEKEYEVYVQKWIDKRPDLKFELENWNRIRQSLDNRYSAFSDDHLYITPNGRYAVLEFDKDDREFFLELDSLGEYDKWAKGEKEKIYNHPVCGNCRYLGHCLTEHYRDIRPEAESCSGFRNLLDWNREVILTNRGNNES